MAFMDTPVEEKAEFSIFLDFHVILLSPLSSEDNKRQVFTPRELSKSHALSHYCKLRQYHDI